MSGKVARAKKEKEKKKVLDSPYTVMKAIKEGGAATRLSMLVMGFGNIVHRQILKGLIFLGIEIAYIFFMINSGINAISMLPSLGWIEQGEVYNEALGIYEYTEGHSSIIILLYGVAALFLTVGIFIIWRGTLKSAYQAECLAKQGKHVKSFREDLKDLFDINLHRSLLTLPVMGILIFNILPLIFMILMAFTNYTKGMTSEDTHLILFDWVGLENFKTVLSFNNATGKTFWSVLGWTITWAIFATFTNYIFGMMLAIVINRKDTKGKSFWRFCFVLSVAVPQFVSLLIMRTMLQPKGAVNVLLQNLGILGDGQYLPFFENATWARVTVIVINLWVGIPFTMLQTTGILKNIPSELYESAKVDGANAITTFFKITLPYMLFVTTPYLITTFTGNINNFNIIYLLSGGAPTPVGATAGKTDLLVTWLYKLTVDKQYYNIGAVIGIMTFVILAFFSLITYRNTGSYKNEEEFQ